MYSKCAGKGTEGLAIDRFPGICAAGVPSAQADQQVSDSLKHYLLKDKVDALIGDAIIPPAPPRPLPPLRKPLERDMRHAGIYCDTKQLVNPPPTTKFQDLIEDLKSTSYASYWKAPLGRNGDQTPFVPRGFDKYGTTFGKILPRDSLYDIVFPTHPIPDSVPDKKAPGVQTHYDYCEPAFDPKKIYGKPTNQDPSGKLVRCALKDDAVLIGLGLVRPINTLEANFNEEKLPKTGKGLAPNRNIESLPKGFVFGYRPPPDSADVKSCLTSGKISPRKEMILKCFHHLNTFRRSSGKLVTDAGYREIYLNLKYMDKNRTGWLPKNVVYEFCNSKYLRFNKNLIEPLLELWEAINEYDEINYELFIKVINHKIPLPDIPKIPDGTEQLYSDNNYSTEYKEMCKSVCKTDTSLMAGVPSGRYFDKSYPVIPTGNYCSAILKCLPQESDMKSNLQPSILSMLGVTHRDMFAAREPHKVRKVFEAAGDNFTDESFEKAWNEAKKYHSEGLVCYETFRRALETLQSDTYT